MSFQEPQNPLEPQPGTEPDAQQQPAQVDPYQAMMGAGSDAAASGTEYPQAGSYQAMMGAGSDAAASETESDPYQTKTGADAEAFPASYLPDEEPHAEESRPRLMDRRSFVREVVETLLLIMAIYTLVNLATSRYVVEGQSMLPSFEGNEYLIVNRFEYMFREPKRGDIVIFHYPEDPTRDFIKRVVGLPGETVRMENGQVFIDGVPIDEPYVLDLCHSSTCRDREWQIGDHEYFVLGDNRNSSQDSTRFGPVDRKYLVGRAWVKYWPPSEWQVIEHHTYGDPPDVQLFTPTPTLPPGTPESPLLDSVGG